MTLTPAFPLGTSFLPGDAVVLRVFESRYLDLMRDVLHGDGRFVSALISAGSEVGGGDQRFNVGVFVDVDHVEQADVGLMMYGHATEPTNITHWDDEMTYPRGFCVPQIFSPDGATDSATQKESLVGLASTLEKFFELLSSFDIAPPAPPGFVLSLLPAQKEEFSNADEWTLFWTLARLLPSTPLSRSDLLTDAALSDRILRAIEEIEHLQEIVAFRYGN